MHNHIPFYSLESQHAEVRIEVLKAIEGVFDSQRFVLGSSLEKFELAYSQFIGAKYCAGVGNGLDAITLSLRALGVSNGDEVIVPSNTFIATWLAVSAVGATIVPVEPDPATYNIDCGKIESAITRKTKAIIPVHLYGQSCDMQKLMQIAQAHQLKVVEDNAQAHGASFDGKYTGSFGHCNATSFYPVKNLGALGDSGAITTDDPEIFERAVSLRNYGSISKSVYEMIGTNSRMDELQAAVLQVKLRYLQKWNDARVSIARRYLEGLRGPAEFVLPKTAPGCSHVFHQFVVSTSDRDAMAKFLLEKGVATMVHYPVPPHLQQAYTSLGYSKGSLPIAEKIAATCLSLPVWPGMTKDQVEFVINTINEFWQGDKPG